MRDVFDFSGRSPLTLERDIFFRNLALEILVAVSLFRPCDLIDENDPLVLDGVVKSFL
ncbi:hypothetical protein D3C76_1793450 [compost metagenome]